MQVKQGLTTEISTTVINVRQNQNIMQGEIKGIRQERLPGDIRVIQIVIDGQRDTNGGMLYNQIKYNWKDNTFVALSKTPKTYLKFILPNDVNQIAWETYDSKGAVVITQHLVSSLPTLDQETRRRL